MGFTAEELAATKRMAIEEARRRPAKGEFPGGDGHLERRFPLKAFMNAVVNHGVSPHDEEYWRDMARLNPECQVKYQGKVRTQISDFSASGMAGALTRFGRVTFRKVYG